VLLHGFQDAASSWDEVAPALAKIGMRTFAPDLRGFGDGVRVSAGGYYHFADYVFDVGDIIDAVSPDDAIVLVGHSMGGTVASLYAGTFPERVALLALLEGLGPPETSDSLAPDRTRSWIEQVRKTRSRRERAMSMEEAMRRLAAIHPKVPDWTIRRRAEQLTRADDAFEGARVWKFDPLHRTTSPVAFGASRWKAHAARITAPTLVVSGGALGFHPEDEGERIAAIPKVRVKTLEGAGHMMHWTQPEALSAALCEHILGA
jgi:pimeloyl-ACP methyl ester carboxylesterase